MLELQPFDQWAATAAPAEPAAQIKGYSDYLRTSLFQAGELTPEAEQQIHTGAAIRAAEDGLLAPKATDADVAALHQAKPTPDADAQFLLDHYATDFPQGSPEQAKADVLRRYLVNKQHYPAAVADVQAPVDEMLADKDAIRRARIAAVDRGDQQLVAVDDAGGRQIYSGANTNKETVSGKLTAMLSSGAIDAADLGQVQGLLASDNGVSTVADNIRYATFANTVSELAKKDPNLQGSLAKQAEALRNRQEVQGKSPAETAWEAAKQIGGSIFLAVGTPIADALGFKDPAAKPTVVLPEEALRQKGYTPDEIARYTKDYLLLTAGPAYRADKPESGIALNSLGNPVLAPPLVANKAAFEAALTVAPLNEKQKKLASAQRVAQLEAQAPDFKRAILGESADAVSAYAKAKAAGQTDSQFVEDWVSSNAGQYSGFSERLQQLGASTAGAVAALPLGVGALFGNESSTKLLVALQKDQQSRAEYARLMGDEFGLTFDIINTIPQVATDILATIGSGGAYTATKTVAKAGVKTVLKRAALNAAALASKESATALRSAAAAGGEATLGSALATVAKDLAPKLTAAEAQVPLFATTFLRSASAAYGTIYSQLPATMSHEEKHRAAVGYAVANGLSTAAITLGMSMAGRAGVESVATDVLTGKGAGASLATLTYKQHKTLTSALLDASKELSDPAYQQALRASVGSAAKTYLRKVYGGVIDEGTEEALDQALSAKIQDAATDTNTPLAEKLNQVWQAFVIGGALGGGVPAVTQLTERFTPSAELQAMEARHEVYAKMAENLRKSGAPATAEVVARTVEDARLSAAERRMAELAAANQRSTEAKTEQVVDHADKPLQQGELALGDTPNGEIAPTALVGDAIGKTAAIKGYTGLLESAGDGNVRLKLDKPLKDGTTHFNVGSQFQPFAKSGLSLRNSLATLGEAVGSLPKGTPYVVPDTKSKAKFALPPDRGAMVALPSLGGVDALLIRGARMVGQENIVRDVVLTHPDQIADAIQHYGFKPELTGGDRQLMLPLFDAAARANVVVGEATPEGPTPRAEAAPATTDPTVKQEALLLLGNGTPAVDTLVAVAQNGMQEADLFAAAETITPEDLQQLELNLDAATDYAESLPPEQAAEASDILSTVATLRFVEGEVITAAVVFSEEAPAAEGDGETPKKKVRKRNRGKAVAPTPEESTPAETGPPTGTLPEATAPTSGDDVGAPPPAAAPTPKPKRKRSPKVNATPVEGTTVAEGETVTPTLEAAAALDMQIIAAPKPEDNPEVIELRERIAQAEATIADLRRIGATEFDGVSNYLAGLKAELAALEGQSAAEVAALEGQLAGVLADEPAEPAPTEPEPVVLTEEEEQLALILSTLVAEPLAPKALAVTPALEPKAAPTVGVTTPDGFFRSQLEADIFARLVARGMPVAELTAVGFDPNPVDGVTLYTKNKQRGIIYGNDVKQRLVAAIELRYPALPVKAGTPTVPSVLKVTPLVGKRNNLALPVALDPDGTPLHGLFTNDPLITAHQLDRGLKVKLPRGILNNPKFKLNPSIVVRRGWVSTVQLMPNGPVISSQGDLSLVGTTEYEHRALANDSEFANAFLPPTTEILKKSTADAEGNPDTSYYERIAAANRICDLYEPKVRRPKTEAERKELEDLGVTAEEYTTGKLSYVGGMLLRGYKLDEMNAEGVALSAQASYRRGLVEFALAYRIQQAYVQLTASKPNASLTDLDLADIVRKSMVGPDRATPSLATAAAVLRQLTGVSSKSDEGALIEYAEYLYNERVAGQYAAGAPPVTLYLRRYAKAAQQAEVRQGRLKRVAHSMSKDDDMHRQMVEDLVSFAGIDPEVVAAEFAQTEQDLFDQMVALVKEAPEVQSLLVGLARDLDQPQTPADIQPEDLITNIGIALQSKTDRAIAIAGAALAKEDRSLSLAKLFIAKGWLPQRGATAMPPSLANRLDETTRYSHLKAFFDKHAPDPETPSEELGYRQLASLVSLEPTLLTQRRATLTKQEQAIVDRFNADAEALAEYQEAIAKRGRDIRRRLEANGWNIDSKKLRDYTAKGWGMAGYAPPAPVEAGPVETPEQEAARVAAYEAAQAAMAARMRGKWSAPATSLSDLASPAQKYQSARRVTGNKGNVSFSRTDGTEKAAEAARAANRKELAALGLEGGNTGSMLTALNQIAKTGPKHLRPVAAMLLAHSELVLSLRFSVIDLDNVRFAGAYAPQSNLLLLNLSGYNGRGVADVLVHELLHAATEQLLTNPRTAAQREAATRITQLRNLVKAEAERQGLGGLTLAEGLKDNFEFISYMLTSPEFQALAKAATPHGQRSLLRRFVEAVLGFFGMNPVGVTVDAVELLLDFATMAASETTYAMDAKRLGQARAAVTARELDVVLRAAATVAAPAPQEEEAPAGVAPTVDEPAELDISAALQRLTPVGITTTPDATLKGEAATRRAEPTLIRFNEAYIAARIAGLPAASAERVIAALVAHELGHLAVYASTTPEQMGKLADSLGPEKLAEIADEYYAAYADLNRAERKALIEADRASGKLTNTMLADEWLRQQVTAAVTGTTHEEVLRTLGRKPTRLELVTASIKAFIGALRAFFAASPENNPAIAAMISQAERTLRQILAASGAEPLNPTATFGDGDTFLSALAGTPEGDQFNYALPVYSTAKGKAEAWLEKLRLYNLPTVLRTVENDRTFAISELALSSKNLLNKFPQLRDKAVAAGANMQDIQDIFGTTEPPLTNAVLKDIADKTALYKTNNPTATPENVVTYEEGLKTATRQAFSNSFRLRQQAAEANLMRLGQQELVLEVRLLRKDMNRNRIGLGMDDSNDVYLTTTYRYFTTAGWSLAATKGGTHTIDGQPVDFDKLRALAADTYAQEVTDELNKAGKPYTHADVARLTLTRLDNYLAKLDELARSTDVRVVEAIRKDLNRFKPKGDIDKPIRALLGQLDDPLSIAINTHIRLGTLKANQVFRDTFAKVALDAQLASPTEKDGYVQLFGAGSQPTTGALAGLYFDPRVAAVIQETCGVGQFGSPTASTQLVDKIGRSIARATGLSIQMKTQFGVGYWPRNAIGGMVLGFAQGIGFNPLSRTGRTSVLEAAQAAWGVLPSDEARREEVLKLVRLGMLNDQSQGRIVQDLLRGRIATPEDALLDLIAETDEARATKDAGGTFARLRQKTWFNRTFGVALDSYKTVTEKLAALDGMIDGTFKANAYYHELAALRKHHGTTRSEAELEQAAARKVKLTFAGHSQVVDFVKTYNRSPLANAFLPFARWKSEVFRTMGNTIPLAIEEIKEGGSMARRGVQRLAGFTATLTLLPAVLGTIATTVFRAIAGDDDDEVRQLTVAEKSALREALPSWQKGHSLYAQILTGGRVQFIDMTYILPHSQLTDLKDIISEGLQTGKGMDSARLARYVTHELIGTQIAASTAAEVLANRDAFDQPIYLETDPPALKMARMLGHYAKGALVPSSVLKGKDIARTGQKDRGELFWGEVLGARPRSLTFAEIERRGFRNLKAVQDEAVSVLGQLASGRYAEDKDIDAVIDRHQEAMNQAQGRLSQFMGSMLAMGSKPESVFSSAKAYRFSDDTIQSAYGGFRYAWKPNEAWFAKTFASAQQGGEQDPSSKVQAIARSVGRKPDLYWVNAPIAP